MLAEHTPSGLHAYLSGLLDDLGVAKDTSLLDIGCGSGAWIQRVVDRGAAVAVGLDRNPPAHSHLDLRLYDLDSGVSSGLGQYGLVTCIEVIEHVENIGVLLDLISAALAPRGVALITTPNIQSLRSRLRALVKAKIPSFDEKTPEHLMPIVGSTLERLLGRRGLVIRQVRQYPDDPRITSIFSRPVAVCANVLRPILPDPFYGDSSIFVVVRA